MTLVTMTLMQWLCDTVDNNDKMFSEKNSTHGKNFRDGRDKSHVCFPLTLQLQTVLSYLFSRHVNFMVIRDL